MPLSPQRNNQTQKTYIRPVKKYGKPEHHVLSERFYQLSSDCHASAVKAVRMKVAIVAIV
jgi:hypothetical protein